MWMPLSEILSGPLVCSLLAGAGISDGSSVLPPGVIAGALCDFVVAAAVVLVAAAVVLEAALAEAPLVLVPELEELPHADAIRPTATAAATYG
jgi:hypothetical protein